MSIRVEIAQKWIEQLLSERAMESVVRDGWPLKMVQAGFAMHAHTWDIDAIITDIETEIYNADELPSRVHHIWPALPGAGVTPLLFSYLVGVPTVTFSHSKRCNNFGAFAREIGIQAGAMDGADVVVVSGSDETIASIRSRHKSRVVAYGHRVSIAIVDRVESADQLATDVVMWHQLGCFSLRGVVFVGSADDAVLFCQRLSEQIAARETIWDARPTPPLLAERAQALGVAQMISRVFAAKFGYVELTPHALDGQWRSVHAVQVTQVTEYRDVPSAVGIPSAHLQGVACDAEEGGRIALELGATRVCVPGLLQAPDAAWHHDGLPNIGVLIDPNLGPKLP